jgi:hypothetical protein
MTSARLEELLCMPLLLLVLLGAIVQLTEAAAASGS